jgi:SAM-dependent methyltransferase
MRVCVWCGSADVDAAWRCAACGRAPEPGEFPRFAPGLDDTGGGFSVEAFDELAELEAGSFWFRGRNRLIATLLQRHAPHAASFLEVGCGTGFVLAGVRAVRPGLAVTGVEASTRGLRLARRRLPDVELLQMDATRLAWRDEFDVVGCFDVLEHVEDDREALRQLRAAAMPGGVVLVTVPQHPRLWSADDEYGHHLRRYTRGELLDKARAAGLTPVQVTSFVSLLLPLMALSRRRRRTLGPDYDPRAELRQGPRLRAALEGVLGVERHLVARGVSLPAGGSLVLVARRG